MAVMDNKLDDKAGGSPSVAAIYLTATRAYSFPASVVPVLLGTALEFRGYGGNPAGRFSLPVFLLTLIGAILAHAGGNVFNDYFDYVKGVDTQPEHGSGVLPRGDLTASEMLRFGVVLLVGAGLCGGLLLLLAPYAIATIAPLALLGLACAVLYTAVLKRFALGDLVIMTAFGFGLTLGAYGVQLAPGAGINEATRSILLLSLPVALLVDAILHANNIRDADNDEAKGVHTVASLLGTKGAQVLQMVLVFGPVALTTVFTLLRLLPFTSLATCLRCPSCSKPTAAAMCRSPRSRICCSGCCTRCRLSWCRTRNPVDYKYAGTCCWGRESPDWFVRGRCIVPVWTYRFLKRVTGLAGAFARTAWTALSSTGAFRCCLPRIPPPRVSWITSVSTCAASTPVR